MLVPLAEIAPDRVIAGRRVADALAELSTDGIQRLPDLGLTALKTQNNRLAWRPPRGNFRPNQETTRERPAG